MVRRLLGHAGCAAFFLFPDVDERRPFASRDELHAWWRARYPRCEQ